MHQATRHLVLSLFLVSFGCAKATTANDNGTAKKIDTQTDPDNCGRRGNVCIARGDGACREGHCRCSSNHDCHWPAECRVGLCHESVSSGNKCWTDDDCAGNEYCIGGHCSPRIYTTEICDGFDNDGDGQADEPEKTMRTCYTGPPGTLGVGACHAGKRMCVMGRYTGCLDEMVPHQEVGGYACDLIDSDCDGCIDGVGNATLGCKKAAPPIIDFIIIMDYSGSMDGYVAACKASLDFFEKFYGDDRFQFSLVTVTDESTPGYVKVLQPLTDFKMFRESLNTMYGGYSGIEPTYDAVYRIAKGDFDSEINFRPGSMPVLIVFGDEPAQTVMIPPTTEYDMCKAAEDRGALVSILTEPSVYPDWALCASKYSHPLSVISDLMKMSLGSILELPCFNSP